MESINFSNGVRQSVRNSHATLTANTMIATTKAKASSRPPMYVQMLIPSGISGRIESSIIVINDIGWFSCLPPFKRFGCLFVPAGSLIADMTDNGIKEKRGAVLAVRSHALRPSHCLVLTGRNNAEAHADM